MRKIIALVLFGLFTLASFAQGDKLREEKVKYIKKKLALTVDEEKKFLPLYGQYMDSMASLKKDFKDDVDLAEVDLTFMSDEECEKLINEVIKVKERELELIKKYTAEFKKVLPIKKVAMIFKAEADFKKDLIKQLRKEKFKERKEKLKERKDKQKDRKKEEDTE